MLIRRDCKYKQYYVNNRSGNCALNENSYLIIIGQSKLSTPPDFILSLKHSSDLQNTSNLLDFLIHGLSSTQLHMDI